MIIYKRWIATANHGATVWTKEGWYLLGHIPLLIRDVAARIQLCNTAVR